MNVFKSVYLLTKSDSLNIKVIDKNLVAIDDDKSIIHPGIFQYFIQNGFITVDSENNKFILTDKFKIINGTGGYFIIASYNNKVSLFKVIQNSWSIQDAEMLSMISFGVLAVECTNEQEERPVFIGQDNIIEIFNSEAGGVDRLNTIDISYKLNPEVVELLNSGSIITQINNTYEVDGYLLNESTVKYMILTGAISIKTRLTSGRATFEINNKN